jgi:hypothetical protein
MSRMESFENKELMNDQDSNFRHEIHSKTVRAGRRTYFFDVKSTRNDEYYLIITESKRKVEDNGSFHYEKHKIFLYREDFEKFSGCLNEIMDFIKQKQPEYSATNSSDEHSFTSETSDQVDFDDLEK